MVRLPLVCWDKGSRLVQEQEIELRQNHSNDVMCSFFATSFAAEGVVSVYVMFMMSTGARSPVWVDRESQFAADAEEESQRGEAMFHAAAGHCNERV
jgi:hypothetical protein